MSMTVLNFHLAEQAVFVVADTLVTNSKYNPAFFTTKVHSVPHWNGLICGTGTLPFILDWLRHVLGGMLVVDLIHLNDFAPTALRGLYASHLENLEDSGTTTIYHFGFDTIHKVMRGFAYRSVNGFKSEPLAYGTYTKPGLDMGARRVEQFPADFVELCKAQRSEEDSVPAKDRVFIGGQIIGWMMQRIDVEGIGATVNTTIAPAYNFPDIITAFDKCLDSLAD